MSPRTIRFPEDRSRALSSVNGDGGIVGVVTEGHPAVLLTEADGHPIEGAAEVEFDEAEGPFHFFNDGSARWVVHFRVTGRGESIPAYFPVVCRCVAPRQNSTCSTWIPKGSRSALCRAAAVALGRLVRKGDRMHPRALFSGKLFKAEIEVVKVGRNADRRTRKPVLLPPACWYSKVAKLLELLAGGAVK